jgi:hypothetical protein
LASPQSWSQPAALLFRPPTPRPLREQGLAKLQPDGVLTKPFRSLYRRKSLEAFNPKKNTHTHTHTHNHRERHREIASFELATIVLKIKCSQQWGSETSLHNTLGQNQRHPKHRKLVLKSGNKNPLPSKYFHLTLHTETEKQRVVNAKNTD